MIFITTTIDEILCKEEQKHDLSNLINKKKYTKSNTLLSYRQINTLSRDRLFPEERNKTTNWRRFSLKDLVYLSLIHEFKKLNVSHKLLIDLYDSFYSNLSGEIAISCCLIGVEIVVTINSDGKTTFYDPSHYLLIGNTQTPTLQAILNYVLNNVLKDNKRRIFPVRLSIRKYLKKENNIVISDKENEILNLIKNKDYSTIKVSKENGNPVIIHAGKIIDINDLTMSKLTDLIQKGNFQDIDIVKRDGKIVNLKIEETIKL